jgi:signal transduction histidine kinase/tetratricopeptide (TPR) repeat protein
VSDPSVIGGRFKVVAVLKSGLGVETLRGDDLETGAPVVIKATATAQVPAGAQLRLEHEASVLREVASPSVAPLLAVRRERQSLYVVTRFIRGVTLADRLARGPLPLREAVAVGRAVLAALGAAHERGVLHRDVKPANVILGEDPDTVTLIDFGLSRSSLLDAGLQDVPVGTVAYVSPEQAGLIPAEPGERSDLYSAGILLFECLAGVRPFQGATAAEVLRQHLAAPPPSLRRLGLKIPRALDELVERLLAKDPRARYQSAAAVLADLDEIAAALDQGIAEPPVVVGARERHHALTEPAFVGRGEELAALERALGLLVGGRSRGLVPLQGESGIGKTRLLREAATLAAQRGVWVLRGQSTDRVLRPPLEALMGIADQVAAVARSDPALAGELAAALHAHAGELAGIVPALATALHLPASAAQGPEGFGEERTLAALVALLDALGSATRPALLLLDDCQWLDDLCLKLFSRWHGEHADGRQRTWVAAVAAFRSDEVPPDSPLRRLAPESRIVLRALGADEVRKLAESMAGELPAEALEVVGRLAAGNPFLVGAVLEGLVESGALVDSPRGWQVDAARLAEAQSSQRAGVVLARRLDKLPAATLRFLEVGAVLGKSFEVERAAELAEQSAPETLDALAEARRRHLVWIDPVRDRCTFVHDRLREAVLHRLGAPRARLLHERAAAALERDERRTVERELDLAFHHDMAGAHARALPHALAAAAHARARHALEVAEQCYRIASRGAAADRVPPATRLEVAEGLGDVLLLRGKYDEAGAWFAQARGVARSPLARAAIEAKAGELDFKRGDAGAASTALERALALLGRRVPRTQLGVALATLGQVAVQAAHTWFGRLLVGRRAPEEGEADLLAARILSRLAYAYWFRRGQVATFWAHLSELNLAERYAPTREVAQAYSEHAISVTGLPRFLFRRGERYAERGLAIRAALGDLWGQGQSLNFHGMLLYAFGHYAGALDRFREALRVLRRTGDRWEADVAGIHIAFCHYRLGALGEAVAECRRVHREAVAIGDRHAAGVILEVWAKATAGALPAEALDEELAHAGGDAQVREAVLQAQGVRLLGEGRPEDAVAAFAAADELVRSVNLRSEYVSYIPLWLAHAHRQVLAKAATAGVVVPELPPGAAAALRRGVRAARRHRGNLPMALRERACWRAMRRRYRGARRDLDASLAEAERQGARLEAARTLLTRAELGRLVGWPDADADRDAAGRRLRELGADAGPRWGPTPPAQERRPSTLSLADRFASIVDHGRRIASALSAEEIHAALCDGAAQLLRAEASAVVAVADGEVRVLASRGAPSEVSRAAVARALREGAPTVFTEAPGSAPTDSVLLTGIRSGLCAPIHVNRRPVAHLYLTHRGVAELFGDEERRIAAYLVTLGGASLERAEAFTAVQALSRTLEQRVEERTAALGAANVELDASLRRLRDTQEQLIQSAKMAAAGTLVAGLSHELNNPLGVILGYAQSHLRGMSADDPVRPALEAIERQARRCADLVNTLLHFSRKRSVEREVTDVGPLMRNVVTLAALKMRRRDVRVDLEVPPPGTCLVTVSPTEIESALLNVLDNAADASPDGATIRMEAAACRRGARAGVEVRVVDRGRGIDRETLAQVFDPFFTTKPAGQGTGLGLPLSRRFVEGHGGELAVESRVGAGTTVRIWLPAQEAAREGALEHGR